MQVTKPMDGAIVYWRWKRDYNDDYSRTWSRARVAHESNPGLIRMDYASYDGWVSTCGSPIVSVEEIEWKECESAV